MVRNQLLKIGDAGHYAFGVPLAESDTNKGTNAALADSWEKTQAFLGEALKA